MSMKYPSLRHAMTANNPPTKKRNFPKTHHLVISLTSPTTTTKVAAFRDFLIKHGKKAKIHPDIFPPLPSMLALRLGSVNIRDAPSQTFPFAHFRLPQVIADEDEGPKFSITEIMGLLQSLKDPITQIIEKAGLTSGLTVELGKLQPFIFRSNPSPVHVLQIYPIASKTTHILDEISRLVHEHFMAAGCYNLKAPRPRNVITFLNTGRRTYSDQSVAIRERIDLKQLYSLDGISQFLSQGSVFPKSILRPVRFDFGKVDVTGIKLQRVFFEPRPNSEAVYDGELRFLKEDKDDKVSIP